MPDAPASTAGRGAESPWQVPNVRAFVAFRLFFNCRFYYPVFTVLFLDFGLTLEQFGLLNALWAVSIVLFEVPSGALADVVGRRRLVVAAAAVMVLELALLLFAPVGGGALLFALFALNRVFSGLAEACASGADEALAYDSLKEAGLEAQWPRVLEALQKLTGAGFFFAMVTGALVYDHNALNAAARWVGLEWGLTRADTLRLPLWLTFLLSLGALGVALRLRPLRDDAERPAGGEALGQAFRQVWEVAGWILRTPFVLLVIAAGLVFDSVVRIFATLTSEYYRAVQLPEWSFGFLGAAFGVLGMAAAPVARRLVESGQPLVNALALALWTGLSLLAVAAVWPWWGVLPALSLFAVMPVIGMMLSTYLNRYTESRLRATVLSFKGLAFNLAYGLLGVGYAALVAGLRTTPAVTALPPAEHQTAVFVAALGWLPGLFAAMFAAFLLVAAILRPQPPKPA